MFPIDKKKAATIIISKMGKEVEAKDEESNDDSIEMYKSFAHDLLQAISDKSVVSIAQVLKDFHEMVEELDESEDIEEHQKMLGKKIKD
jgi:hypothetical protein